MTDAERFCRVDTRLKIAIESAAMPKELALIGPAGTGKTFGVLAGVVHSLCVKYPGLRILVCRQTRAALSESVCETFENAVLKAAGMTSIAGGATRRHRTGYVYPNGSEIVLTGLDKPDRVASTSYDVILVNEAVEVDEDSIEILASRLDRPGRPAGLGWLILDSNPGHSAHWLKKRIDEGRTVCWHVPHEANPAMHDGRGWTARGRTYLDRLDRLQGTRRKRLRDGLWASGEGTYFSTFSPDRHVTSAAEFDPRYPVHLSVDTGVCCGAVLWQLKDEPGGQRLCVFGDMYLYDVHAFEAAGRILAMVRERCGGRCDVGRFDPAGGAKSGFGGTTIATEFARAGLNLSGWIKYPGCVTAGLTVLESFVAVDPPKFSVHPRCRAVIDALGSYRRTKVGSTYTDDPAPDQHPFSDVVDPLRSGLLDHFGPAGRRPDPGFRRVNVNQFLY